jgi:hypothetical protein
LPGMEAFGEPAFQRDLNRLRSRVKEVKQSLRDLESDEGWIFAQTFMGVTTHYQYNDNGSVRVRLEGNVEGCQAFDLVRPLRSDAGAPPCLPCKGVHRFYPLSSGVQSWLCLEKQTCTRPGRPSATPRGSCTKTSRLSLSCGSRSTCPWCSRGTRCTAPCPHAPKWPVRIGLMMMPCLGRPRAVLARSEVAEPCCGSRVVVCCCRDAVLHVYSCDMSEDASVLFVGESVEDGALPDIELPPKPGGWADRMIISGVWGCSCTDSIVQVLNVPPPSLSAHQACARSAPSSAPRPAGCA